MRFINEVRCKIKYFLVDVKDYAKRIKTLVWFYISSLHFSVQAAANAAKTHRLLITKGYLLLKVKKAKGYLLKASKESLSFRSNYVTSNICLP